MYWSCANCTGTSKKYKSNPFHMEDHMISGVWKIKKETWENSTQHWFLSQQKKMKRIWSCRYFNYWAKQRTKVWNFTRKRSVESNLRSCFLELFWCWFCVERSSLEGVKLCKSSLKGLNLLRNLQTHKRLLCVFFVYLSNTYWY